MDAGWSVAGEIRRSVLAALAEEARGLAHEAALEALKGDCRKELKAVIIEAVRTAVKEAFGSSSSEEEAEEAAETEAEEAEVEEAEFAEVEG